MANSLEILAARYGKSFADVILENSARSSDAVVTEFDAWTQVLQGELLNFLSSPSFDTKEKEEVLGKIFAKASPAAELQQFLKLLLKTGHIRLWPDISVAFKKELQKRKNETVAKVKTAFPLSASEQQRLKDHLKSLTKKEVLLDIAQDSSLIGGIQVEVGGALYDSSISGYLNRLKQECAA